MDITVKREEGVQLYAAISGLCRYSTQAGFHLASNLNAVEPIAKAHDKFIKNLQMNYATKDADNEVVFEEDGKTPKVEGKNLVKFDEDYEKYLNEDVTIEGLKPFGKENLKVRISRPGVKSELVTPDLPGEYLARLTKHGIITELEV